MPKVRFDEYLSAINELSKAAPSELVKTGQIADALGISGGYVSTTLTLMAEAGLITHQPHIGVKLTESGLARARLFARRLRTVQSLLKSFLTWDDDAIDAEARKIEPVVSDNLIDAAEVYLLQKGLSEGESSRASTE